MKLNNSLPEQTSVPSNLWQQELRDDYLAHCLPSAARIQFRTALAAIELCSIKQPARTRDEFDRCLKAIEQVYLIGRLLQEEGRPIKMTQGPLNEKWRSQIASDLFYSLPLSTTDILLEQGLMP